MEESYCDLIKFSIHSGFNGNIVGFVRPFPEEVWLSFSVVAWTLLIKIPIPLDAENPNTD